MSSCLTEMTKINSNPPQNFHYIFLMHRFMIFKRSVQYANFFVPVYMLLFAASTTSGCWLSPPTPSPHTLSNAEAVWSPSMLGCHFSLSWYLGCGTDLEDSSPCLGGLRTHTRGGGEVQLGEQRTGLWFFSLFYSSFMILLENIFFLLLFLSG